jgi:HEPN domain-containing protein
LKRNDLQELASLRLREARILLENGCWDGAYYLSGYVIECALKACVARQTERHDFPDKARANASHTHDLPALMALTGLENSLKQAMQAEPKLDQNWATVRNWREHSRYSRPSQVDAEELFHAIAARRYGLLRWLKRHW